MLVIVQLIDAHMALYERTAPLRQELVSGIIGDLINTAVDKSERVRNDRLIRGLNGEV